MRLSDVHCSLFLLGRHSIGCPGFSIPIIRLRPAEKTAAHICVPHHTLIRGDFLAIVQTDVPMTSERYAQTLRQLADTYPFLKTEILTNTAFGRPVYAIKIGDGERNVLFTAAHHANEWITSLILLKFVEEFAEAIRQEGCVFGVPAKQIAEVATIYTVPMVNPDGVDLVVGEIPEGTLPYEMARAMADFYPGIPFPEGW